MAFTYCQVPVVYQISEEPWIAVTSDDSETRSEGGSLDGGLSRAVFDRLGTVTRIDVGIPRSTLR